MLHQKGKHFFLVFSLELLCKLYEIITEGIPDSQFRVKQALL